jgi:GalNAc-alpha-(1->4)-GalNAc-alpha-(1->3)-diNAcBac-PP-undecaprenol alpha-1,4-N-acetyl-D-galactosaminyltransferase
MRVTFVIFSLAAGGAERIMSIMANYWAEKGWYVTLLTLDDGSEPSFFDLHPRVNHRTLGIASKSSSLLIGALKNFYRVYILREAIKASKPHIVISFMDRTNVLTVLATAGLHLSVIVSEHCDPYCASIGKIWELLRDLLYSRATYVIALSERALSYFGSSVRARGRVIPNPVVLPSGEAGRGGSSEDSIPKIVMAMGRLDYVKGYDMLLHAFTKVAPHHPEWFLEIWGEGPLRADLEALRDQLGLDGRVRFPGKTKHPLEKMKCAALFVLSSRTEGFPVALCEAMACGLAVISFDCPSGPREIIRHGMDGILVPAGDVNALAIVMDRLMTDASVRQYLARQAPEVLVRFGLEKIMRMWEELIREAVQ